MIDSMTLFVIESEITFKMECVCKCACGSVSLINKGVYSHVLKLSCITVCLSGLLLCVCCSVT